MKKSRNTIRTFNSIVPPLLALAAILLLWELLAGSNVMPSFMMPSPGTVWQAFVNDFDVLLLHAKTTLWEAFSGLFFGILFSIFISIVMDAWKPVYKGLYPIIVVTQTIPSIAIAPLLLLWFGYGTLPKVILIAITTFFPVTVGLLDGYKSADPDSLNLLKSMGAGPVKRFLHIKLPYSLGYFFSGLKISVTYSIVGAVISEWLGGQSGLGVFMTRVRKSFAYDRMFSVILFISIISLLLLFAVNLLRWWTMPWERKRKTHE